MRQEGLSLKEAAESLFKVITDFKQEALSKIQVGETIWSDGFSDFDDFVENINGDESIETMTRKYALSNDGIYDREFGRLLHLNSVEEVYEFLLTYIWTQFVDQRMSFQRNFWKEGSGQLVADRMFEAYENIVAQKNFFVDNTDDKTLNEFIVSVVGGNGHSLTGSERAYNIAKFGIEKFVPGEISFYNIFELKLSKSYWGSTFSFTPYGYSSVFYSTEDKQLLPSKRLEQNSRTMSKCASCQYVVSYNKDTVTARPAYSNSNRNRSCMFCIIHRHAYVNFWNLDTQRFEYRGGDLDALMNKHEWSDEIEAMIPRQSLRNIKRYGFLDSLKEMIYHVPFIPDTRQRDYSYELYWRYWFVNDEGNVDVKSITSVYRFLSDKGDSKNNWELTQFPIGMELELEARNNVEADTEQLLIALHKDFPYGLSGVANHKGQLAVGSYDGSLGRNGIEFKFQPMTAEFVRQLPDGFWDVLKNNFRGYYNKRCGNHMNMPSGLFTRQALALWIAWHNNAMLTYHEGNDDDYCALEDVMQRANASYAAWMQVHSTVDNYEMARLRQAEPLTYADNLLHSGAVASQGLYTGSTRGFSRNDLVNYTGSNRIEYRGFASATIKDRILKNYEFLTALHEYFEALSATGITLNRSENNRYTFTSCVSADERAIIRAHIVDEHLFYKWVTMTRAEEYPYLTKYINSAIMPKIGAKSMSRELFDYVNERTA